jgi:C-terminal processing protease CtpA/Prc
LTIGEVDAMFEKVRATRGLIMDMRGYPQGTAWSIAPRINTRGAKVGAQFRRAQVSAMSEDEGEAGFYFSQPLPALPAGAALYTAPTVMLIDDRAISQSEHSGLFFEAANGTTFIGTASAGANGDVTRFGLPGGIWVGFTGHDVRHADGRQLQRVGLKPHVEVAPTRAGLRAGRDEVLERAIRHLEETAPR